MEKHFFAGGNTEQGFFNYFNNIINLQEAECVYILKGGSGVGKSTIMKKFGKIMEDKGYFVEYIHCSSDSQSLDGVYIEKLKIAMVDGTAPHTIDPKYPAACEVIVNLGQFLNDKLLKEQKDNIIKICYEKGELFKSAYNYIKSAGLILEESNAIYEKATDEYEFLNLTEELSKKIFSANLEKLGKKRCLFAEAITPLGLVDFSESLYENSLKVWYIDSNNINYISKLLFKLLEDGIKYGYEMECYFNPIKPDKMQHLIIKPQNVAIVSKPVKGNVECEKIDFELIMNAELLKQQERTLKNNENIFNAIMEAAIKALSEAKKHHEALERIYIKAMDYAEADKCLENILAEVTNKILT